MEEGVYLIVDCYKFFSDAAIILVLLDLDLGDSCPPLLADLAGDGNGEIGGWIGDGKICWGAWPR